MAPWTALSNSLSSTYLHLTQSTSYSTTDPVQLFNTLAPLDSTTPDQSTTSSSPQPTPATPPNNTHHTPRRLSASGSQVITGVLDVHPQFSVFRKSNSNGSLDGPAAGDGSPLAGNDRSPTAHLQQDDGDEMEHLASPQAARDLHASDSPTAPAEDDQEQHNTSNTSSEWHLSLASDDMPSLQWGDGSSGSIHLSPPSPRSPPPRSKNDEDSAVRLVNTSLDSPPQPLRRSSTSRDNPNPNRASLSRSQGLPTHVQFSPLSLAPSPLIGFPPLPPPVPSLLMALDREESPTPGGGGALGGGKTILKMPRTPGTGQSVRFSASTVSPRRLVEEESPSAVAGAEHQPQSNISADSPSSFDEENSSLTHSTSFNDTSLGVGGNSSSHMVASFLSKLQAAIPSPDVSLLSPPPQATTALNISSSTSSITETPSLSLTSPSGGLKGLGLAMQQLAHGQGQRELWDESNPFAMRAGCAEMSEMRSLEVTREEAWGGGLSEVLEGSEGEFRVEEMDLDIDGEGARALHRQEEQEEGNGSIIDHFPSPSASNPRPSSNSAFSSPAPTPIAHSKQQQLESSTWTILPSPSPSPSPNEQTPVAEEQQDDEEEPLDSFRTSWNSRPSPISSPSRLSSSPAPSTPNRSLSTSSPSTAAFATASATKRGASSAFYRQFLQKRARESLVAADELGRLMRSSSSSLGAGGESMLEVGEMSVYGTPGEGASRIERHEPEEEEEPSVYFSPTPADRRMGGESRSLGEYEEQDEEEMEMEMEQSFDVEELRPSMLNEMRREESEFEERAEERYDELEEERGKWLSPIAEASEPNTTINTLSPWTNSPSTDPRQPPPFQPSFSSFRPPIPPSPAPAPAPPTPSSQRTTMTLYHSTPDSRIPHLSQRRPAPSPSLTLNPFSLPSSSASAAGTDLHLIQSLLSAQSDLNSNSSTQKFLLASLVTNLRNEVEGKEAVIRNLKDQVEEGRRGWRDAVRELEEMEAARSTVATGAEDEGEARIKIEALEEVVERLTEELEKRVASERELRRGREEEVEQLRREVGRAKVEVRDSEIRLRHARIGLSEAEEAASKAREGERVTVEEKEKVVREKEEARRKGREEALERERVVAMLREELAVLQHQLSGEGGKDEEVERRMEVVKEESRLEIGIVREQLAEVEATVIHLRSENQSLQSSYASLELSATQFRQQLEHSLLDAQSFLSRTTAELASLQHSKAAVDEGLESTTTRLELVERELDRLSDEMTLKDDKLALQTSAWEEHQVGMARLMESVGTMEEEAQAKALELNTLREQMDEAGRDAEKLVEDRDRRLTESETQLSARIKRNESLVDECNRLKETVAALRRGSADREVKYARLKKIKAQQDDNIFGLNIALEAKQQEAATWKRQLASARLIAGTPAPSLHTRSQPLTTASRPIPGSSNALLINPTPTTSTNLPFLSSTSSAKTVVADFSSATNTNPSAHRSRERPLKTSSVPDEHPAATPSRSASTSRLSRKPSVGFGSSARREAAVAELTPAPTPARRRSASSASVKRASSTKENQQPSASRRQSEEREETPMRSRMLVAA